MSLEAKSNAIVSLAEIKSYLRIPESDISQDDFLQYCINVISDSVERCIRGPVVVQTFSDEIHSGDGTSRLHVTHQPLVGLQNDFPQDVMVRSSVASDWQILEQDPAFIRIDPAAPWHIQLDRSVFPSGTANIKVCYLAGYAEVPGQITRVVTESVAELFKESNQGAGTTQPLYRRHKLIGCNRYILRSGDPSP